MIKMDISVDLSMARKGAEAAKAMLTELRMRYDLSRWEFTDKVRIAPFEIPHSHPVLTLNSQYAIGPGKDEELFLATYVHEQIHWLLDDHRSEGTERASEEFKGKYPNFHEGTPSTAQDEYSTYLHFAVNWLELTALIELHGTERARAILARHRIYSKIYGAVLTETDVIETVLLKTGVLPLPQSQ